MDHLRVFGCDVWVTVTRDKGRQEARAELGKLVGYVGNTSTGCTFLKEMEWKSVMMSGLWRSHFAD